MNQIERLQRTYGYFVDKSQWTQLSELFTDDATLEIGGKGLFLGKPRVLEYMQTAFGPDGAKEGSLANHMQFQSIPDISADGRTGWIRSRAYVMSIGGWGLPLYENEYRKENGVWKISRLTGPFTMYTSWEGWGKNALNNTWPDKFDPPPDLPPSTVYLTYPAYYIIPVPLPESGDGQGASRPTGARSAPMRRRRARRHRRNRSRSAGWPMARSRSPSRRRTDGFRTSLRDADSATCRPAVPRVARCRCARASGR